MGYGSGCGENKFTFSLPLDLFYAHHDKPKRTLQMLCDHQHAEYAMATVEL